MISSAQQKVSAAGIEHIAGVVQPTCSKQKALTPAAKQGERLLISVVVPQGNKPGWLKSPTTHRFHPVYDALRGFHDRPLSSRAGILGGLQVSLFTISTSLLGEVDSLC